MSLSQATDVMPALLSRDTYGQHKKGSYRRSFASWIRQDKGQHENRDAGWAGIVEKIWSQVLSCFSLPPFHIVMMLQITRKRKCCWVFWEDLQSCGINISSVYAEEKCVSKANSNSARRHQVGQDRSCPWVPGRNTKLWVLHMEHFWTDLRPRHSQCFTQLQRGRSSKGKKNEVKDGESAKACREFISSLNKHNPYF